MARAFSFLGQGRRSILCSLVPVAFWGCTLGGQSGDDGSAAPPRGDNVDGDDESAPEDFGEDGSLDTANGNNDFQSCQVTYRPDPEAPAAEHSCQQLSTGGDGLTFECDCNGERQGEISADTCSQAMQQACGVDPAQPGYCAAELADCWDAEDGQLCQCHGQEQLLESDEADCETAAFSLCATSCEHAELSASCSPLPETYQYACECRGQVIEVRTGLCQDALQSVCEPRCRNERGQCFEEGAYLCSCTGDDAGAVQRFSYDELGGDDCELALNRACGEPEAQECESSAGSTSGRCSFEEGSYTCVCNTPSGAMAAGGGAEEGSEQEFDPAVCEEELRAFCPQAFGE